MVEFLYRSGGETVYVCSQRPNGLTEAQYNTLISRQPKAKAWGWRMMRRNPSVYVRGRIRHADHATIMLSDWHRRADEYGVASGRDAACGVSGLSARRLCESGACRWCS